LRIVASRRLGRTEVQIAQHHARALGDELLRDGKSQALRTARDDGGLTGQQRHLITLFAGQAQSRARQSNIIFHI
jgi:hypothetical protein